MKLEIESTAPTFQSPFAVDDLSGNAYNRDSAKVTELLKAGITAAKEGNRAEARHLLLRVTESHPENETAWLWLASISEYPEELVVFLNQVLKINPDNERALEWMKATRSLLSKTFVQRGVTASREDQKEFAAQCFQQAIAHDNENELAWLWLASISDAPKEKMAHLQKVLWLNPANETAQTSLASVKQQTAQAILKKANVAAISGEHDAAREMLDELMDLSPQMEEAWILKAYLSDSPDEKIACFEKVLSANPENETARAGIDSLNAIKEREIERRLEQKAQLEALEVLQRDQAVEAEENFPEEIPEQLFAENAALSNESFVEEYPVFDFSESEEDIHKTVTAEENKSEPNFPSDTPTQELDETFVQSLEIQSAFSNESQSAQDERQQEVEEFFAAPELSAEENLQADSFEPVAEFSAPSIETKDEDFTQAMEMPTESLAAEYCASESTEFEIMTAENQILSLSEETSYFEEDISRADENPQMNGEEIISPSVDFADSESFSRQLGSENIEATEECAAPSETFVAHNPQIESGAAQKFNSLSHSSPELEPVQAASQPQFSDSESEVFSGAYDEPQDEEAVPEINADEIALVEDFSQPAEAEENSFAESTFNEQETLISVQKDFNIQPESFPCPFCAVVNEPQSFLCASCRSVLTLSELEMLLSNQEADRNYLAPAIEKMEGEMQHRSFSADELIVLGIAHLNAKNLRQGLTHLQEALRMNQNNVVLGAQVNSLAIRLVEIETQESKAQDAKSRTILVVDDSATVRKLISGKLEKCGHTVVLAVDGMDALAKVNEFIPDLILLDITMPRMDGYQVCKLIRNNNLTKEIPVVMISGKDGFFDKVRGRMAGSTGYITKPFGPDTLMRTIESYLN